MTNRAALPGMPSPAALSFVDRYELPTWGLIAGVYAAWAGLLVAAPALPWWVLMPAGAYVVALHFSVQHEAVHGFRSCPEPLRTILVWPPLGLWLPFALYRRSHSIHHRNSQLTVPGRDTESVYHRAADWARYPPWWRAVLMANQTLPGRLAIGPVLRLVRLVRVDIAPMFAGNLADAPIWAAHVLGVAGVLALAGALGGLGPLEYLLFFAAPGMVLGWLRPFLEHRWGERPFERVAAVESNVFFGLLFLFNNLHVVHHLHPTMPWYRIPGYYRAHRHALLELNGGFVFRGYGELAVRYWRRPAFVPVHPEGP